MKKISIVIIYFFIGLLFAFYVWSQDVRTFDCGDVVIQHTYNFTTGTGSFKNPDPEHCVRSGFDTRSIAMIPYFTVAWPAIITRNLITHSSGSSGNIDEPRLRVLPEMTDDGLSLLVIDANDIPDGWYAHNLNENTVFLTKEREQELLSDTGLGAVGGYMLVYALPIEEQPEEWIAGYVDFRDALVLDYRWDFVSGRRHIRVDHHSPGDDARTDYFLAYDRVVIAQLSPLESDRETKKAYLRFLYNAVAPLVDTAYSRDVLRENCKQEIPRELIDDSVRDSENGVVTVYWWDGEIQENQSLSVSYEPETDFEGCSESVKEFLRHLPNPVDKI